MTYQNLSFTFHSDKPNNEDVEPLLYENWLAVADGMGGSGCMPHSVDIIKRESLKDVLSYALEEYEYDNCDKDELKDFNAYVDTYLQRAFEPCINDEINTSARWASRVIMTRFLYYISTSKNLDLSKSENIRALNDFIKKGLCDVKTKLNLMVSNPDLLILPTTFAALKYSDVSSEGECIVDALWAGDSRCYVLDANGLRLISKDDEDERGLLDNNFGADVDTQLHLRRYSFKVPFTLLCASDGFFDAYDKNCDLPVEAKLLNDIANCNSAEELREALYKRYEGNKSDDTSVAFVPVGYVDYNHFKDSLDARREIISNLYAKYSEYSYVVSLTNKPEHMANVGILNRFETKFKLIIEKIAEAYYSGKQDIMLTDWWRSEILRAEQEFKREYKIARQQKIKETYAKVEEGIACNTMCFKPNVSGYYNSIVKNIQDKASAVNRARARLAEQEEKGQRLQEEKDKLLSEIQSQKRELAKIIFETTASLDREFDDNKALAANANVANLAGNIHSLCLIENKLYRKDINNVDVYARGEYRKYDKRAREYVEVIHAEETKTKELRAKYVQAEKEFERVLANAKRFIPDMVKDRYRIFSKDFIAQCGMDSIFADKTDAAAIKSKVAEILKDKYSADKETMEATLKVFKENPAATSCIDDVFNASKLADFRMYYQYKDKAESQEFVLYKEEITAYNQNTGILLADTEQGEVNGPICVKGMITQEANTDEAAEEKQDFAECDVKIDTDKPTE